MCEGDAPGVTATRTTDSTFGTIGRWVGATFGRHGDGENANPSSASRSDIEECMGAPACQRCGTPLEPGASSCLQCGAPAPVGAPNVPRRSKRSHLARLVAGAVVLVTLLTSAELVLQGAVSLPATSPPVPTPSELPVGVAPSITPGPDLGDAWTTAPAYRRFVTIDGGTRVASDQYLVMLSGDASEAAARRVAASAHGTLIGHLAYLGIWKIRTTPARNAAAWYATRDRLAMASGVDVIAPVSLVVTQAGPDCARTLHNAVYAGDGAKPYDMIGVRAAWEAYYASGLPKAPVHVGIIDTALTRGPRVSIPWQFSEVTFAGPPTTTTTPRAATAADPRTDGFNHADGILGILAGDGSHSGVAGIASPLGRNLEVSQAVLGAGAGPGAPATWRGPDGTSYSDGELLNTIHQIEAGATIISGSWGAGSVSPANTGMAAMWKAFFDKMAKDHPEVLFVYAAGNNDAVLDGTNYYPAGIPAANVITVGNVTTANRRVAASDKAPAGGSGEVTLAAPGEQAVWGRGADGQVRADYGGTSSATPMVSGAAALIRAIDPGLSALQLKQLLVDNAGPGDPAVGGLTLRVDLAVRKAIDGARAKAGLAPLTDAMITAGRALCQIAVSATLASRLDQPAGTSQWTVRATLASVLGPTAVTLVTNGGQAPDAALPVTSSGQAVAWPVLVPQAGATITITRLDNGFWVWYTLRDRGGPPARPTPSPTVRPSPVHHATPPPSGAGSGIDCTRPPAAFDPVWSLACGKTGP